MAEPPGEMPPCWLIRGMSTRWKKLFVTKERHGGHVTALVMGPKSAREALKTAIAMGCDSGLMLTDKKP